MSIPLLEIEDLYAKVGDKEIIKGFNLTINEGEVHAIMGPNGAGKSTLSYVLCGKPGYDVTSGKISYKGKDLLKMSVEERACEGLFLSMQKPVEIPGVSITPFLKHALNSIRAYRGEKEMDTMEFVKLLREEGRKLNLNADMLKRSINVGFSGGEAKRLETLQMAVLRPDLAILDEADSGVDIDAMRIIGEGVNACRNEKTGLLVITHYQRLLNYIVPDYVHVYTGGKIVKTGGKELAEELERTGYSEFTKEQA